ncbi:hypothetical protein ONE63_004681 [Megalurothrips usitatus]|uniref:Cadherin domain-containing protein n=1 Tax=Megalurothrips usitatus TaxID=439358 RepID=A0AAV7X5W5_9NEOP|nr:hypothetical protein ONE63_004681 [Megalurothrips usitatus]
MRPLRGALRGALRPLQALAVLLLCGGLSGVCPWPGAGPGPGPGYGYGLGEQMQSRAVETRVQLDILEGQPRGTVVGAIPTKPGFTYRFNEPPRQFTLNATTGEIRTTSSCVFTVFARDHGSPRQDGRTYVTVSLVDANDHDPTIRFRYFPATATFATVDENAANGSVVAAISVVDQDEGLNGATAARNLEKLVFESTAGYDFQVAEDDGRDEAALGRHVGHVKVRGAADGVRYSVVFGDPHRVFSMDERTGALSTAARVDREQAAEYRLTVAARLGLAYGQTTVNVTVQDVNDNEPRFARDREDVHLAENAAVGQEVYLARAQDRDAGVNSRVLNGLVTYELVSGDRDLFALHRNSGTLTLRRPPAATGYRYQLAVKATDEAVQVERLSTDTYITVLAAGEPGPEFIGGPVRGQVAENMPAGTSVATVHAALPDRPDAALELHVTNVTACGSNAPADRLFAVDPKLGVLATTQPLDREAGPPSAPCYNVEVFATVAGAKRPQTATTTVSPRRLPGGGRGGHRVGLARAPGHAPLRHTHACLTRREGRKIPGHVRLPARLTDSDGRPRPGRGVSARVRACVRACVCVCVCARSGARPVMK